MHTWVKQILRQQYLTTTNFKHSKKLHTLRLFLKKYFQLLPFCLNVYFIVKIYKNIFWILNCLVFMITNLVRNVVAPSCFRAHTKTQIPPPPLIRKKGTFKFTAQYSEWIEIAVEMYVAFWNLITNSFVPRSQNLRTNKYNIYRIFWVLLNMGLLWYQNWINILEPER